ncbi:MAG: alpha-ribazole phosphatase [Candidatus Nitrohelix vancouverensis]|uniref:Alpha-ribazole phosphatase n=1 Tax=Candidatus Nitrohelix vancouverensis TaxID=2705534 RepID=A0A7T0C4X0_9BACT|nr:MAG: alpha-ribazole phosphatase [Candidatus Nitrohelix vancouverensis]
MKLNPSCRVYLIRHGETANAGKVRFNGHHDIRLSPRGEQQLAQISEAMQQVPLEAVYCSNLSRTQTSADIIAKPHGLTPIAYPELRELSFGQWEGLSIDEVEEKFPGRYMALFRDIANERPPEGESFHELQQRTVPRFMDIIRNHPQGKIAIVAHGGVNRTILCQLLGIPIANMFRLNQEYAAVNVIQFYGEDPVVELMGADHNFLQWEAPPEKTEKIQ